MIIHSIRFVHEGCTKEDANNIARVGSREAKPFKGVIVDICPNRTYFTNVLEIDPSIPVELELGRLDWSPNASDGHSGQSGTVSGAKSDSDADVAIKDIVWDSPGVDYADSYTEQAKKGQKIEFV